MDNPYVRVAHADGNVLVEVDHQALPPGVCLFIGTEMLHLTNLRIDLPVQQPPE